ncbi:MAG: M20 family metallopeptidase [Myxococcales bacterium]|nr:M20 family metallopeptidase [Myxococcales bacterium]
MACVEATGRGSFRAVDANKLQDFVDARWAEEIVPRLVEYIRIPNKSPLFDSKWAENGYMDQAVALIEGWCRKQPIQGMTVEVLRTSGRTPLIFIDVPGHPDAPDDCVLLYGHLDKQPEMTGWREGLGPWEPVIEGDKLYGRGGADDGYAAFGALTAIAALQAQGVPHTRCVVLIEASEESGSPDLPYYIEALGDRIGTPSLVVCLDSGCGDYEHLWCTTSLRGLVVGNLSVDVLREGVHSGEASGVVASSFRVARTLLSRLEDETTGEVRLPALFAEIPAQRREQAAGVAEVLGDEVVGAYPFLPGVQPMATDRTELVLNRTWRPMLSITGADGMPPLANAGNVLRPGTALKVSLRLPPTVEPQGALRLVKQTLEQDPPYGAKVSFEGESAGGWNAPPLAGWLEAALDAASQATFGRGAVHMGEGGSIPFMGMLGEKFPEAQFMITGVLGPASNAHGPNEFLHLPTGRKVTACVAHVLAAHVGRPR